MENGRTTTFSLQEVFTQTNFVEDFIRLKLTMRNARPYYVFGFNYKSVYDSVIITGLRLFGLLMVFTDGITRWHGSARVL